MPLIPNPLIRPWSPSELPILPFLAPRLLEPWTTKRRRACPESKADYSPHSSVSSVAGDGGRIPLKCSTSSGPDDVAQPQTRRYHSPTHARSWKYRNHRLFQGECAVFFPRGAVRRLSSKHAVSGNEREGEPPLRAGDDYIEGPDHHHVRFQDEPDTTTRNRLQKAEGLTHKDHSLVLPAEAQMSSASNLQSRAAPSRKQRRPEKLASAELHSLYRRFAVEAGLPVLSTKYVSVLHKSSHASESGFTFHWWSTKFAVINQIHEDELQGYAKVPDIDGDSPKFPLATRLLFIKQNNVSSLASFWRRVPKETRCHVWAEIMITAMEKHPDSALKCLIATYQDPFPPSWAVSDCLNFIISHYFSTTNGTISRESFQPRDFQSILRSVQYLLYRGVHASQRSMSLLQAIMNNEEFKEFYSILEMAGHHLNGKSLLRFVYRAARARNTDLAFKILQRAPLQGIDLGLERWPQICSVLLVRRYRDPDAEVSETELFEYMLKNGFRPGVTTYNILIQNSIQAGDSETAWQIYEMVLENGIVPDGYTFSILIHDAKLRRDGAAIGKLASLMAEYGIQNAHATTDILDAISRIHKAEYHQTLGKNRKQLLTAFPRILPLYMEVFALEPLIEIIPGFSEQFLPHARPKVVDTTNDRPKDDHPPIHLPGEELSDSLAVTTSDAQDEESGPSSKQDLLEPSVATLNVMLQSYCDYLESSRNATALLEMYDHFQDLVSKRRPVIAPLARDPRFYNYMLSALGSCLAPLEDCLRIIKDMQAPYIHDSSESGNAESEEVETVLQSEADEATEPDSSNDTPDLFRPPQPNIHTWTSMLHIFMHRRQPRAAEKVLQIMFEKGLRPNAVTWHALTTGYMRLQDPAMVADSFNRSTEAGHSPSYAMSSRWWFKFKPKDVLSAALRATVTNSPTTLDDVADAIGSRDSPSPSVPDDVDSSTVPGDRSLDAVAAETTDIYSTKKRRLVTSNSPVYPNWMFDALLRLAEKDVMVHGKSEPALVPQALSVDDSEQLQEADVTGETSRLPINKMITRRVKSLNKPLGRRKLQSIRDSIRNRKEQNAKPHAEEGNESI